MTGAAELLVDVAIVGAGAAGATLAAGLARRNVSVALVASHDRHPPEFRAEKIGDEQIAMFEAAGLGDAARGALTIFDGVWLRRFGRLVERGAAREYGGDYGVLVNALRAALPAGVAQVTGRVDAIETGPDRQCVALGDGRLVRARLVVMATGLSEAALKRAGIGRETYSRHHSLAAGFDLDRPPSSFPWPSLVWAGDRFTDPRLSYLTLFPIGDRVRANLFVYRSPFEDWTRALRDDPNPTLNAMIPRFEREYGALAVDGPVMIRPIDLARSTGLDRDGIVAVGDAFMTVCPITGTGMDKALNDVTLLARHVPGWLATSGMGAGKIRAFYADPAKTSRDRHAVKISVEARAIKFDPSPRWRLRRVRSRLFGRYRYLGTKRPDTPWMTAGARPEKA